MEDVLFEIHAELESRHWWFVGRRRILLPLIETAMRETNDPLIVDVGCGTGGTVAALNDRFKVLDIDMSDVAIATARELYPDCTFRCGKMPDDLADVRDQTGLYLLMDVLEHIEDDRQFLSNLVQSMKPGANLLVTVPASPVLWSSHDVTAGHVRRYTRETFTSLFRELPAEVRLVADFNTRLYPVIRLMRLAGRVLGNSSGENRTDFFLPPAPVNKFLENLFAGEKHTIMDRLDKTPRTPLIPGVSMLALLKRV